MDIEGLAGAAYRQISESSILVRPNDVRVGKEVEDRRGWRTTTENRESKNATTACCDITDSKDYDEKSCSRAQARATLRDKHTVKK